MYEIFNIEKIPITNLGRIVELSFALPGTTAEIEQLFSVINNVFCPEKGQMNLATLEAILDEKFDSNLTCQEFYNSVKTDKVLLEKVLRLEK